MIGAPRPLPLAKPAAIDTAQAARYFGARGEPDEKTMALLETCALPLLAAATPRAVWLEADTAALAEAGILRGGDVMKHLENCPQAVLLAVTLGPGVDAQIRRAGVGDIAAGVASDALGSALAEQAADAAEAELRQWAAKEGKYLTGRFSPGFPNRTPLVSATTICRLMTRFPASFSGGISFLRTRGSIPRAAAAGICIRSRWRSGRCGLRGLSGRSERTGFRSLKRSAF